MLGMGGMGVVCTAYDPKLDRKVAVKLLRDPGHAGSRKAKTGRARLVREAKALAKLSHPNIVTVHDVDTTAQGRLYMAMEYVQGRTLSQWVAQERPQWREVLDVFEHAGRGLAAAHAAGITHRDFKPANVLIGEDGRVRVLDFGLAKTGGETVGGVDEDEELAAIDIMDVVASASDAKLTRAGRIVGTPAYMAPEQRRGEPVGPASDQFGFAVALFEALFGVLPFSSHDHYVDATLGIIVDPPKDSSVPNWVLRVVRRGLEPDPPKRFARMDDMLAALRADPARRRRRAAGTLGVLGLGGLGAYGLLAAVAGRAEPCDAARARGAQTWTPARHTSVGDSLRATGTSYADYTATRVLEALDEYVKTWTDARVEVCEATRVAGDQSEALLDVRMTCLDRMDAELDALLDVLADADASVVERAVSAVHGLRRPAVCTTAQPSVEDALPDDPALREEVQAVQDSIDEAFALMAAGRYAKANEVAAAALASDVDHLRTRARAHLAAATANRYLERHAEAEALLERAGLLAAEAGDAATEAAAWTKLVYLVGVRQQDPARGLAWSTAAAAAVKRAGDPPALLLDLESDTATVLTSADRLDEALEHHKKALALARAAGGSNGPALANALGNVGVTMFRVGDTRAGEAHLREALDVAEASLGPDHPRIASRAQNLGNALASRPQARAEARALLQRALAIRTDTFGPEHPRAAELVVALARLEKNDGRFGDAQRLFERALRVFEAANNDRRVAQTLNNIGLLHLDQARLDDAQEAFARARARFVTSVGEGNLFVARTDHNLCRVALAAARFADARQACAQAVPVIAKTHAKPHESVAQVRLDYAAALKGLGEGRAAQGQLSQAREILARLPEASPDLADQAARLSEGL